MIPEAFQTGALRVPTKTDYSQLSHVALRLMAETQAEGNEKYGYGNWQKGIPVSNLLSHALGHIFALMNGDTSENHLGHALWNLEKAAHFIETKPEMIDVIPMKEALSGYRPVDPNPDRNTNCWFCGDEVSSDQCKVIPPKNIYRQAHASCFISRSAIQQRAFSNDPPGVKNL